jgi:hypothetical protein
MKDSREDKDHTGIGTKTSHLETHSQNVQMPGGRRLYSRRDGSVFAFQVRGHAPPQKKKKTPYSSSNSIIT